MGLLKLFAAIDTKQLYQNHASQDIFRVPFFATGDQDTLEFTLLTRNPDGGFLVPWKRENPSSYSLRIGLYRASDGLELATATVWNDDLTNSKKIGKLVQTTANVTTAFPGGTNSVDCLFEAEIEDALSNRSTVMQESVVMKRGLITAATVEAAPGEVAATQHWVKGLFVPWVWPSGAEIEAVTPNGTRVMIYVGDDLQFHIEPLT